MTGFWKRLHGILPGLHNWERYEPQEYYPGCGRRSPAGRVCLRCRTYEPDDVEEFEEYLAYTKRFSNDY